MKEENKWQIWIQLLLGLVLTLLFFYMLAPFLVALFLGAITALLAYPLFSFLKNRFSTIPNSLLALIVTLSITLVCLLPMGFILLSGTYKLIQVVGMFKIPSALTLDTLYRQSFIEPLLDKITLYIPVDKTWIKSEILGILKNILEFISQSVGNFMAGAPSFVVSFFIVILSLYFFILDGAKFIRFISILSPLPEARSLELFTAFQKSCRGSVLGLFASGLIQGFLICIFFLICNVPNAFLIGVVSIVMGLVPIVGTVPITLGASIYLFAGGHIFLGCVMLIGLVITATADNIVRSMIMKGQSQLHPLLAIVSALGAVNSLGPTGIFLGPIISGVFISFLNIIALELSHHQKKI